jgi:putative membrane protein
MKLASLTVLAVLLTSSAYAGDNKSATFLKKAIQGNFAEIDMGKLAHQNGTRDDVKQFGQMLNDDHSKANQKALDAAKSMDVIPPDSPSTKQKSDFEKMSKLSGARFDSQFAKHMVMDHEKDIAEYKKASKKDDAAGNYAKAQIEVLQKHLETAKSLKTNKTSRR